MTRSILGVFGEHQVLTLGTGKKPSWRKIKCGMAHYPVPVDYEANYRYSRPLYDGICINEDAEKHQWSSYIYVLPPPWKNIIEETKLRFVGTSDTGDIVLSPYNISDSFYLLYYNPERNTITRVEIQGMEAFKPHKAYAFLDYAENVVKLKPRS
ncbi:unnamed protein product [Arabidopsis halleri]